MSRTWKRRRASSVEMGAQAVIVKGGHMERATDVVFDGKRLAPLGGDKRKARRTLHGTGCTFAAAIDGANGCRSRPLVEAAMLAKAYVTKAIEKSYPAGKGLLAARSFLSRMSIEPLPARHPRSSATWIASRRGARRALSHRQQKLRSSIEPAADCCYSLVRPGAAFPNASKHFQIAWA